MAGMDKDMNQTTRIEVLEKLRRRYGNAGAEHKRKLIDQAVQLLQAGASRLGTSSGIKIIEEARKG